MSNSIYARGVNEAYYIGLERLKEYGVEEDSRNGPVLVMPHPVITTYTHPNERVLFQRETANPFFHFMEGLWMLAGRNDVEWISTYNKSFAQFSDDGKTFHGAYGFRWKHHFGSTWGGHGGSHFHELDQLERVIQLLQDNPKDRRAVLTMWDPLADLGSLKIDVPCNLSIAFRVNRTMVGTRHNHTFEPCLDMTVFNRSNDIIWGAYGANAVHMSMLQEYVAGCLEIGIGQYHQVSNNYHAYKNILDELKDTPFGIRRHHDPYKIGEVKPYPMVQAYETWMTDLYLFIKNPCDTQFYSNSFFFEVARQIALTWDEYKKQGPLKALKQCEQITAEDWRDACASWLKRKVLQHEERENTQGRSGQKMAHIADDK